MTYSALAYNITVILYTERNIVTATNVNAKRLKRLKEQILIHNVSQYMSVYINRVMELFSPSALFFCD